MGLLIPVIKTSSCMPGMGMALYNWMKNVIETALLSDALSFTHPCMVLQMFKNVNWKVPSSRWAFNC